jgi:hypothetical protein
LRQSKRKRLRATAQITKVQAVKMAKIKRKGESGAAKNFISRNMALKK